jgi:hypothetical protein
LKNNTKQIEDILVIIDIINENDLMNNYNTLLTVCNWNNHLSTTFTSNTTTASSTTGTKSQESPQFSLLSLTANLFHTNANKNHQFLTIKDIFNTDYLKLLIAVRNIKDNLLYISNKGYVRSRKSSSSSSSKSSTTTTTPVIQKTKYLLHLFNFWLETYHHQYITLDSDIFHNNYNNKTFNDYDEIVFPDIPNHSAHIYSIHLSIDSYLPKYLGSNLHFTCNLEISRFSICQHTNVDGEKYLKNLFEITIKDIIFPVNDLHINTLNLNNHHYKSSSSGSTNTKHNGNDKNKILLKKKSNSFKLSNLKPIIKSIYISFEDHALKDPSFNGYIWVFLPNNPKKLSNIPHLHNTIQNLSFIHIIGSAVEYTTKSNFDHNSKSSGSSSSSSSSSSSNSSSSTNRVELVKHIIASKECAIEGCVYRISVEKPAIYNSDIGCNSGSSNRLDGHDYIVISWIYDIIL